MLVGACYTEAEVRRQKDEQVRQNEKEKNKLFQQVLIKFQSSGSKM